MAKPKTRQAGSTPIPTPTKPSLDKNFGWWGDEVKFAAQNLDPIPYGNISFMFDRPVRAFDTSGGNPFATWANFKIPDDSRAFAAVIEAHGLASDTSGTVPMFYMVPRGIGPFTNIHGVVWAPQTGRIWVASDGIIHEYDIFLHNPTDYNGCTITGLTKPYVSRVTPSGMMLAVDGVLGVAQISQVSVSNGAQTPYAATKDTDFTRNIRPVGVAVDPDGSACYVADGSTGKVVKIPSGAGSGSTIIDAWGGRTFSFADPCGIDVHADGHEVIIASNDGYPYQLNGQTSWSRRSYVGPNIRSLEVDADASAPTYPRVVYDWNPGNAEAFNLNPVEGAAARYHGGRVIGYLDGTLTLQPDWNYYVQPHLPQRVVINNAGQTVSYPSSNQHQDRIIQIDAKGWYGVPLRLRVIDPPDLSPYAPEGGWWNASAPPSYLTNNALPVQPYEGNDNRGATDFGLSNSPNGPWNATVWLRPGYDNIPQDQTNTLHFYLKIPDRYAGDNFQVEVTKCRFDGTTLPQRVAGLSAVYTSWKREFVEQDKMFRKGGVLYSGVVPPCDQISVYDWQNLSGGETVVVFDTTNTAENGGETRTVQFIQDGPVSGTKTLTLDTPLTKEYFASSATTTGPPYQPVFTNHRSAGIGVLSDCVDCFFQGDMSQMELAFDDAYVEYIPQSSGEGAVPYLAQSWFDDPINAGLAPMWAFSETWFSNFGRALEAGSADEDVFSPLISLPHNYVQLLGASIKSSGSGYTAGQTLAPYDVSFVFQGTIELAGAAGGLTPKQITKFCQHTTVHELGGHQFNTNGCSSSGSDPYHDTRKAWCENMPDPPPGIPDPTPCPPGAAPSKNCVMHSGVDNPMEQKDDGVSRFCLEDLYLGDPSCGTDQAMRENTAIRTHQDPN